MKVQIFYIGQSSDIAIEKDINEWLKKQTIYFKICQVEQAGDRIFIFYKG